MRTARIYCNLVKADGKRERQTEKRRLKWNVNKSTQPILVEFFLLALFVWMDVCLALGKSYK